MYMSTDAKVVLQAEHELLSYSTLYSKGHTTIHPIVGLRRCNMVVGDIAISNLVQQLTGVLPKSATCGAGKGQEAQTMIAAATAMLRLLGHLGHAQHTTCIPPLLLC